MPRIPHKIIDGVEHKRCGKCSKHKLLELFNKDKNNWDSLRSKCKECMKKERLKRKSYIKAYNKSYWKNRDVEEEKRKKRKWREVNRDRVREKNREYYLQNLEYKKEYDRAYREKNWELIKKRNREWRKRTGYERNKRKTDLHFRVKSNISRRLREVLNQKKGSTMKYVGCDTQKLLCHIEQRFTENMSWRQYHLLHLDHRVPCNAFDLSNPLHQRVCFWYKNLQPLWAKDNMKKSDKYKEEDKQQLIKDWIFFHI